jgi:hypothetical protein
VLHLEILVCNLGVVFGGCYSADIAGGLSLWLFVSFSFFKFYFLDVCTLDIFKQVVAANARCNWYIRHINIYPFIKKKLRLRVQQNNKKKEKYNHNTIIFGRFGEPTSTI